MSCSIPSWLGICSARKDKLQGIEGSMLAENKVDFNNAHPVLRRGVSPGKGRTFGVSLPCITHLKAIRRSCWVSVPLKLNITVPKGHQQTKCPVSSCFLPACRLFLFPALQSSLADHTAHTLLRVFPVEPSASSWVWSQRDSLYHLWCRPVFSLLHTEEPKQFWVPRKGCQAEAQVHVLNSILGRAPLSSSCIGLIMLTHLQERPEPKWCISLLEGNQEYWVFVLACFGANVLILQGTEH